jgi:crotonobetainyl-CoA:carnitine CoA-transferase CaiB-like acyl-CoA transferase
MSGKAPPRTGSRHPSIVPYGTYRTRDGWIALAIFTSRFWKKFCAAVGRPELGEDVRFRRTQDRMTNREALDGLVEAVILDRTTAEWETVFTQADVPASAILSIPEAVEHAQTRHRGMFPTLKHETYGAVRVPGPPLQLGGASISAPKPPPLLGEDTNSVLRKYLAMAEPELEDLQRRGIIGASAAGREAAQ